MPTGTTTRIALAVVAEPRVLQHLLRIAGKTKTFAKNFKTRVLIWLGRDPANVLIIIT